MKNTLDTQISSVPNLAETKPRKDWFGYSLTAIITITATVATVWYSSYTSQKEMAEAEIERVKAVKQSVVIIVEEHVLNGKNLEINRLLRLIDQRRRNEKISIPIPVSEVVEQAEFNIASSRHLPVAQKEAIKPLFDSFYKELDVQNVRNFTLFQAGGTHADLVNDVAKKIQEGKTSDALAALQELEKKHASEVNSRPIGPSLIDGLRLMISTPAKLILILGVDALLVLILLFLRRQWVRWCYRRGFVM